MGRIIILENTKIMSSKIKTILIKNGFQNVEELNMLRISAKNINQLFKDTDFVLLDLDSHGIDVVELIRALKSNNDTANIPIISFSEKADVSIIKKVIVLGCLDFILKPFDEETLIRKVLKVVPHYISENIAQTSERSNEFLGEGDGALNWTDDFEIGMKEIDEEHRKIIEEYGKLYSKMKDGVGHDYYQELLAFLVEYVSTHFAHEEKLQEEIGYDKCVEHKKIHDNFKLYVNEMIENNKDNPATDKELIRINLFIKDWLIHHILIMDKKINVFLHKEP